MMNRGNILIVTTLLGLAIPQAAFAQSNTFTGTWQLNVAKSKFTPGPGPKSEMVNLQIEGQNVKATFTGIDAAGNPINISDTRPMDGMPHPMRTPNIDAAAMTPVDDYTIIFSHTKAGKLVSIETVAMAADGKTFTITRVGVDANERPFNNVSFFDKQ
jgi:hypothetical protein